MFYAPRHGGELVDGRFDASAEREDFPASAVEAARQYWTRLATTSDLSRSFRAIARAHAGRRTSRRP